MKSKYSQNLKNLVYPYQFALKEGENITTDSLDYSLMMLQVDCSEVIRSPKPSVRVSNRKSLDKNRLNSLKKVDILTKEQLVK